MNNNTKDNNKGNLVFQVKNLSKRYKKKLVVDSLSLEGDAGEIVGFLGPNGAGKTTTIKMMTGLTKMTSGSIHICGYSITNEFEKAIANVGAIVETPYLYENMTGEDNLRLFAVAKNVNDKQREKIKELTGLKERLKDKVKDYSLGMKQRLGIGVALLSNPPFLILDEPTNGLDPIAIRDLRLFLKHLAHQEKVCILISSHMLWEMEKLCDRVIIISEGRCIGEADINQLISEGKNLEDCYVNLVEENQTEEKQAKKILDTEENDIHE